MAITLTPQIKQKIQEYEDHCLKALAFLEDKDYEHCTGDFRKSCEALFKILIFDRFGNVNGLKIILGQIDFRNIPSDGIPLAYQKLLTNAKKSSKYNNDFLQSFKDIQGLGNGAAHNPNSPDDKTIKIQAELSRAQSYKITKWLYNDLLNIPIQAGLMGAYNGNGIEVVNEADSSEKWNNFYSAVDEFSRYNRYILIAPPEFSSCSDLEIKALTKINWSFVLDFNPDSKSNGLFKTFEEFYKDKLIPIIIEQKGQKNIVGEGVFKINWLFSNGISSIADTITSDIRAWIKKKYPAFIIELFRDFFSRSTKRYTIIYLYDKIEYIEEIVRSISQINEGQNDITKHVFVYQNSDLQPRIQEFEKFGIQMETFNLTLNEIISGISSTQLATIEEKNKAIIVPARTAKEEITTIDVSSSYPTLLDNGIEVVHQQIDNISEESKEAIPSFYKGQKITWKDIANEIDVRRNKTNSIVEKIKNLLSTSKCSIKFELKHFPGAGGTTVGRRIAFELRNEYPTIIISKYNRTITPRLISDFADQVQKSILAIVEASEINSNELDELTRKCNSDKKNIIFLYLVRTYNKPKDSEKTSFLKATMLDINERDRFISKFKNYSIKKEELNSFIAKQPSECELIDFSLSLDLEEFNENHILNYVKGYVEKMLEKQLTFVKYVAIIYQYSQHSVSDLIFRNLFSSKSLSEELRQITIENQFIRKLLLQEMDINEESTEYWRPRFSKFSEYILKILIDPNWKDHISIHVIELIKNCKENNQYLDDEIRKILRGVLLERNNQDLLGSEEEYKGLASNEQFSSLLKDIGEKQKQKEVLQSLVENYPEESHFLGHFGRFLYEKAEEINDYKEAEDYINRSFEFGGDTDSNLQHIAGMCQRRILEFYSRNYSSSDFIKEDLLIELIERTDCANTYFNASREIDPYNIHAYIAQIQTIIHAIDFGKQISGISKKEEFITSDEYSWFAEQFSKAIQLVDEARMVIEHLETNGKSNFLNKSTNYLRQGEAKTYEILGDYSSSVSTFKSLSDTADRNLRPYFRSMYIYAILLKKVKGQRNNISHAWEKLNTEEITSIDNALNSNILQDPGNIQSFRLWLKFIRYSSKSISLNEILTKIKIWYENSSDNHLANLECSYYLYVIYSCLAMRAGDSFSDFNVKEAQRFSSVCIGRSNNSKFTYEWYGKGDGIKMLVNHKDHVVDDFSNLLEVKGTISRILSKQQGKIKLECGLDAFFVPVHGNFMQGKDETTEVLFYVGFRHDGLMAWNVRRVSSSEVTPDEEIRSVVLIKKEYEDINRVEDIEDIEEPTSEIVSDDIFRPETTKIEVPKVVGKIDLSQFDKFKKKR